MEVVGLCSLMAALTTAKDIYGHSIKTTQDTTSKINKQTEILPRINTELIVDDVISKNLSIEKANSENTLSFFSANEQNEYTDDLRELKGLCTSIITNEFLKSENNMQIFVGKIVELFEETIKIYCQKKGINNEL